MSTTVRVSERTRQRVAEIAEASGQQMQQVLEEAVSVYARERFWDQFTAGYESLASDPVAWAGLHAERADEAASLADDLSRDDSSADPPVTVA